MQGVCWVRPVGHLVGLSGFVKAASARKSLRAHTLWCCEELGLSPSAHEMVMVAVWVGASLVGAELACLMWWVADWVAGWLAGWLDTLVVQKVPCKMHFWLVVCETAIQQSFVGLPAVAQHASGVLRFDCCGACCRTK